MKVLTSTISFKLYFIGFILGATFLMFNLTSCGTIKHHKHHPYNGAKDNHIIYPGW